MAFLRPGSDREEQEVDLEMEQALAPFAFSDPRVGYDSEQEVYYGPGMPNPDDPGAGCSDDSSDDEMNDPNVLFPTLREDDLEDSNFAPSNVTSLVPVPNIASSAKVPTQLPAPVPNLQLVDHVMYQQGQDKIYSRPVKPRYNLRPRDPQAPIPRVWDNCESDTNKVFSTGTTMYDIVCMMEDVGLLPMPGRPPVTGKHLLLCAEIFSASRSWHHQ